MKPTAQRITLVSASVGAGHDGAAAELARRLTEWGFHVQVHDFLDTLPAAFGRALRSGYALQLRVAPGSWGWLLTALSRHPALTAAANGLYRVAGRRLHQSLPADTAAIVSTYPLASQALGGMRQARPAERTSDHLPHRHVRAPAVGSRRSQRPSGTAPEGKSRKEVLRCLRTPNRMILE